MSHELAEHMEHAAHEAHGGGHGDGHGHGGGKSIAKYVGLTMAVLGVLLALCSAMVGGARTSMIATMVEKTDVSNRYQTVASKYRLMESQLQSTHAFLITDPEAAKKVERQIDELEKTAGRTPMGSAIKVDRLETANLMNAVIPSTDDVVAMAKMTDSYKEEREAAKEWAESYEDKVEAYEGASEHYEWGQLCAEIGIVLASVALLLGNQLAWILSCVLGVGSLGLIGGTMVTSHRALSAAEKKIHDAEEEFNKVDRTKSDDEADKKLIEECIKMGGDVAGGEHAPDAYDKDKQAKDREKDKKKTAATGHGGH